MMSLKKINPFHHDYFLGYVNQVLPQFVKVHFPSSILLGGFTHFGQEFNGGLVGNFVVIEGEKFGFLGRITELILPEHERLSLNEKAFQTSDFHPTGKIEILLSFDLYNPLIVKKGLTSYPNIGAKVYVSSGELVQEYMSRFGVKVGENPSTAQLGTLVVNPETKVEVSLQSIFGRHCAVVGTTGGGKSYTVSNLLEKLTLKNKAIIVDATGEYSSLTKAEDYELGINCVFHYKNLTVADLFVLFRPSGQAQQPILLEAITSLKLVNILQKEADLYELEHIDNHKTKYKFQGKGGAELFVEIHNGCLVKQGQSTNPINRLRAKYIAELNDFSKVDFDISKLNNQIVNECFRNYGDKWDNRADERNLGNASSLILRIHQVLHDPDFQKVFAFSISDEVNDLIKRVDDFLGSSNQVLRLSFEYVPTSFQIREIVANAIGTYLLRKARQGFFDPKKDVRNKPLTLFVDEAHQFLNRNVKDEYFENTRLEAFDLIAKECRKRGLFLCIATQMPRDIPIGTLSQMGTFIVHRLINHNDKEAVVNACSSANRNTLDFLPVLGEGEAILTGVDFPMPVIMKFDMPKFPPNSETPKLA